MKIPCQSIRQYLGTKNPSFLGFMKTHNSYIIHLFDVFVKNALLLIAS